jgi:superfamily II DNA helicase RecQ
MEFLLTADQKKKEIERIMKLWYGTGYKWKSQQQQESTEHVVSCISPLFIILPTSVGKTVTFLLPAKMLGAKTTVVITPLIALGLQLKDTCKEYGLDAALFQKGNECRAQVVIVVTETAGTDDFKDFVMRLQMNKQLDRVVWDEVHMLAKDVSYRGTIAGSSSLQLSCQLVFVSATCPPSLVEEITELMAIPIPHVVRQEYWKPGFRYSVTVCLDKYETCKETVDSILRDGLPDTKILVFCKSSQEVTQWAREYGAHQYHSALQDKQQQWASWTKGLTTLSAGMRADSKINVCGRAGGPSSNRAYSKTNPHTKRSGIQRPVAIY